ncbi:MAG: Uncharacterized protein G01um1014106_599 [Parcubacteria group bacterium Gr01-1014_106]|nr:MAG: Uncharacterized protein G01um1014106_599 [Parcubacteria group bacterium Gr01-1014_106]
MSGTDAFLAHIKEHPSNNGPRLAYADWLEEHGVCDRAELIRLHCAGQHQDRVTALIQKHGRSWAAEDLGIPASRIPEGATCAFHRGFIFWPVTVDYSQPLEVMIAAGQYGYVNEHITAANFPISGTGIVPSEIILVHFDRDISSDNAVAALHWMGLEPARLEHATAFGATYQDVQRAYPIVFLGSYWVGSDGRRRVPCLDGWSDGRGLRLRWWDGDWGRFYRFAAVRPTSHMLRGAGKS